MLVLDSVFRSFVVYCIFLCFRVLSYIVFFCVSVFCRTLYFAVFPCFVVACILFCVNIACVFAISGDSVVL